MQVEDLPLQKSQGTTIMTKGSERASSGRRALFLSHLGT